MKSETKDSAPRRHRLWVRCTHWGVTLSFLALIVTGSEILMVHPRLYWGNAGNDLMRPWLELPVSRNFHHGGWENQKAFFNEPKSPVTESRVFRTFNQNSWGRSLHFLAGWCLVLTGLVYLVAGFASGHLSRNLLPDRRQLRPRALWEDFRSRVSRRPTDAPKGPSYGLLQRSLYAIVVLVAFPLIAVTGFTMSPAITAAHPWLLDLCGGYQSARSVHFLLTIFLILFLAVHVLMVVRSGFRRQMRAMTVGGADGA